MKYDREYFLTHHVGTPILLEVTPDVNDDSHLGQLARVLSMRLIITGTVIDVGEEEMTIDTAPPYAVGRPRLGGNPFLGRIESRERVRYENILSVLPRGPPVTQQ